MKIGPFLFINNRLLYNACLLSKGRKQTDKTIPADMTNFMMSISNPGITLFFREGGLYGIAAATKL